MKKIFIVIYLIFNSLCGISQTDFYRVDLNFGFDYGYQMTKFSSDPLFSLLDIRQGHRLGAHLKADIYINRNWGTYIKGQTTFGINSYSKTKLNSRLESFYGDDYYVKNIKSVSSSQDDSPASAFVSVGGTYRLIQNKWNFQFGIGLGAAVFNSPEYSYYIKEKGSNEYYEIALKSEMEYELNFFLEPSIKVSYALNNRLRIFLSGLYTALPASRIGLYNNETNLYTENTIQTKLSSSKWYQLAQLNLGITIGIWRVN